MNRQNETRIYKVIKAELVEFFSVQKVVTLVSQKEIDLFLSDVFQKRESRIEQTEKWELILRMHMQTSVELRVKESIQNAKSVATFFKLHSKELKFNFTMLELKALIELIFTVFQKSNQLKSVLKNFEYYKNRPQGIIRLAKFAREK